MKIKVYNCFSTNKFHHYVSFSYGAYIGDKSNHGFRYVYQYSGQKQTRLWFRFLYACPLFAIEVAFASILTHFFSRNTYTSKIQQPKRVKDQAVENGRRNPRCRTPKTAHKNAPCHGSPWRLARQSAGFPYTSSTSYHPWRAWYK